MSYEIIWDEKARDFLRKIPQEDAQRIIKKVNSILDYPQHCQMLVPTTGGTIHQWHARLRTRGTRF